MNIVEPIFAQFRNKPTELALCAPGTELSMISYGRLARSVNNACQRIVSAGLVAGNTVAVFVSDPIFHGIILIALTRLGIVTLSGKGKEFVWRFPVDALIADKPFASRVGKIILTDSDWIMGDDKPLAKEYIHQSLPDEVCRIILTSGTTGDDKAISLTNRMMAARIERQYSFFGPRAAFCSRTYVDMGLATSLGIQLFFGTLWRGGSMFLPGDSQQTVSAFPIYRVQNVIASPSGLLELVTAMERRPEYQCGFGSAFSGGSLLTNSLSERIRARICADLTKGYGSTEAAEVASMPAHFASDVTGAVGYVMPGVEVQIVDSDDTPLPSGKEGIVRINSETGVKEYLDDPEETLRAFRNGWFYPGDIGYLTKDNMLVISGRTISVINIGGDKMNPEKVEEVLSSHPSVHQVAVVPFANENGIDELCALIVPRSALIANVLREFCHQRLPSKFVPTRFIAVGELPQNEMGKIERLKLSDLARSKLN
jgi:fatty-acyl-CoA synthase